MRLPDVHRSCLWPVWLEVVQAEVPLQQECQQQGMVQEAPLGQLWAWALAVV